MKIVHVAGVVEDRPKSPSKREKQVTSSRRWAAVQNQKNYRAALKKYAVEIEEIIKIDPGWAPTMD